MNVNRTEVINLIDKKIKTQKGEIINILIESDIPLRSDLSNQYLLETVLKNLKNGNNKLIIRLGKLIDKDIVSEGRSSFLGYNIDITKINKDKDNTNTSEGSTKNNWWQDNKDTVLSTGAGILGALFAPKPQSNNTQNNDGNLSQSSLLLFQQKEEEERLRLEAEKKRKRMMMIGGGIGLLLLAGIVTFIVIKKKGK